MRFASSLALLPLAAAGALQTARLVVASPLRMPHVASPLRLPPRAMVMMESDYERSEAFLAALEAATSKEARRAADVRSTELRAQAKARSDLVLSKRNNALQPEIAAEAASAAERAAAACAKKLSAFRATAVARRAGDERGARILESDALEALLQEVRAVEDEIAMLQFNVDAVVPSLNRLRAALSSKLTAAETKQAQAELDAAERDERSKRCLLAQRVGTLDALRNGDDEEAGGRQRAEEEAAALRAVPPTASEVQAQRLAATEVLRNQEALAKVFDAPANEAVDELSALTARQLASELERAVVREDFFRAAAIQKELASDARKGEIAQDALQDAAADVQAEEDAALERATDAGVAWLLAPRDGVEAPAGRSDDASNGDVEEDEDVDDDDPWKNRGWGEYGGGNGGSDRWA